MTRRRHPAGPAGIAAAAPEMMPLHDDGFFEEELENEGDAEQPSTSVQALAPPPKLLSEPTNSDGVPGFDWNFGDFLEFDTQFERINIGLDEDDGSTSATEVENEEDDMNGRASVLLVSTNDGCEEHGRPHFSLHNEELQAAPEMKAKYLTEGRIRPTGCYINPSGEDIPNPYALAQLDDAMQQFKSDDDAASHVFHYPMNRRLSIEMAKIVRERNFHVKRWKHTNGLVGFNYFLVLYKKK